MKSLMTGAFSLAIMMSYAQTNTSGLPQSNIGIGIANAEALLHVKNVNAPVNTLGSELEISRFTANTVMNSTNLKLLLRRHALNGGWENFGTRLQHVVDITNQGYLEFNPPGEPYGIALGTGTTELMRFKLNGNIGIRTNNPRGTMQLGDQFVIDDGGWKSISRNIAWDHTINNNARIVNGPAAGIFFTEKGNIAFMSGPNNNAGASMVDGLYSLVIHNSGQIGIGSNYDLASFSDATSKLFVHGGIRARKVKVDMQTWPDYVFYKSYKLRPLSEVQKFIEVNNHLPDIPSAATISKDGLDLGDTQAVLLKKIEELTLYLIELDNKVKEQQQEIDALRKHNSSKR